MRPRKSKSTYTETLHDEVCVYEWTRHEVHALNATAASVWQMCDGKTTTAEIAERLGGGQLPHAADLVALALEDFRQRHLLEGADESLSDARAALSRRALLRRGVTAALLPIVTSIVRADAAAGAVPGDAVPDVRIHWHVTNVHRPFGCDGIGGFGIRGGGCGFLTIYSAMTMRSTLMGVVPTRPPISSADRLSRRVPLPRIDNGTEYAWAKASASRTANSSE
jgi:hypothetical protein